MKLKWYIGFFKILIIALVPTILSGCNGCYFFVKIENLDDIKNNNSDASSNTDSTNTPNVDPSLNFPDDGGGGDNSAVAKLFNLPLSIDSNSILNISVGGVNITHYKYKLGQQSQTDCSNYLNYSNELPISNLITDDISNFTDGTKLKICVVGSFGGNNTNYQLRANATTYQWTKDSIAEVNILEKGARFYDVNKTNSFKITMSQPKAYDVKINYTLSGSAVNNLDFNLNSSSVTIPAGLTSATINFSTLRNSNLNSEKSLNFRINETQNSSVVIGKNAIQFNTIFDTDNSKYHTFKQVSSGSSHTCALDYLNHIYCWGEGISGSLGNGSTLDLAVPTLIDNSREYQLVAVGTSHSCGLTIEGKIYCWGDNSIGALGDGTNTSRLVPTLINSSSLFKYISLGSSYSCAITLNDQIQCWGYNIDGQLGIGSTINQNTPLPINSVESFSSVSAGNTNITCGITKNQKLYCWGLNSWGALGDGTTTSSSLPVAIDPTENYSEVSANGGHTCGITTNKKLKCWGLNDNGQIGDGTLITRLTPTDVDINTSFIHVTTSGDRYTCAITEDQLLKCWGKNDKGQLGDSTTTNSSSPINVNDNLKFESISGGDRHVCGITKTGSLYCWGINTYYTLGTGDALDKHIPTLIIRGGKVGSAYGDNKNGCALLADGELKCWGANSNGELGVGTTTPSATPVTVGTFKFDNLSYAYWFGVCGVSQSKKLYCWGNNDDGRVGDGTLVSKLSPTLIDGANNYVKVITNRTYTCAIRSTSKLYCWGRNSNGQLGINSFAFSNTFTTPQLVDGSTDYKDIFISSTYSSCGITTTGHLKCWGYNSFGQLGDGTTNVRVAPVDVDSGEFYSKIIFNGFTTCGFTQASQYKCWGSNYDQAISPLASDPQLTPYSVGSVPSIWTDSDSFFNLESEGGLSYTPNILSGGFDLTSNQAYQSQSFSSIQIYPTLTLSSKVFKKIATGLNFSCGIDDTDHVFCWGSNSAGQLGSGLQTESISVVKVDENTTYSDLSAGQDFVCGILSTQGFVGQLKCWGNNSVGQLGIGSFNNVAQPIFVDSGEVYSRISTGRSHTCGVTFKGQLKCWGDNFSGQLGNGNTVSSSLPLLIDSSTSFKDGNASLEFTCALTTEDKLKCWGSNYQSQLGDGTTTQSLIPQIISGADSFLALSKGFGNYTCAITLTGQIKCWGTVSPIWGGGAWTHSTPTLIDNGVNYKNISVGYNTICGIESSPIDGQLKCWGSDSLNTLGNNSAGMFNSPQIIDSGVTYSSISRGSYYSCGILSDGHLKCWGRNENNQLGFENYKNTPWSISFIEGLFD